MFYVQGEKQYFKFLLKFITFTNNPNYRVLLFNNFSINLFLINFCVYLEVLYLFFSIKKKPKQCNFL